MTLLLHGLTGAGAFTALTGWPLALAGAGLVLSCVALLAETLQLRATAPVRLELRHDGGGRWIDRSGTVHTLTGVDPGCNSGGLVTLRLRGARRRGRWLLLAPDSAPPQELHRLRLWMRWLPSPGGQGR